MIDNPDDPFENIRKSFESINKAFEPYREQSQQINAIFQQSDLSETLKRIDSSFKAMRSTIPDIDSFKISTFPAIQAIQNMNYSSSFLSIQHEVNSFHEALSNVSHEWSESLNRISSIRASLIPDVIYPRLNEMTSWVTSAEPVDATDELQASLTVRQPTDASTNDSKKLNWEQLLAILFVVIQIIQAQFISFQNSNENERYHQEQMTEIKHQTEIQEQELRIQEERLTIERDRLEQIESFMEFIKPLIQEDQTSLESDSENE